MRAYLLSGGLGTRLRSVLGDVPKALAPLGERTFLETQIEWIKSQGIAEIVLSLGVGAEQIVNFVTEHRSELPDVKWKIETTPLGTAGGLAFAAANEHETFLAINGDTLAEIDLPAFRESHEKQSAVVSVACYRVSDASARGLVDIGDSDRLVGFREKSAGGAAWVSGGLYLCEPELLQFVPSDRASSLERDIFPALLEKGKTVAAFRSTGEFFDIGTPAGLKETVREWSRLRAGNEH